MNIYEPLIDLATVLDASFKQNIELSHQHLVRLSLLHNLYYLQLECISTDNIYRSNRTFHSLKQRNLLKPFTMQHASFQPGRRLLT